MFGVDVILHILVLVLFPVSILGFHLYALSGRREFLSHSPQIFVESEGVHGRVGWRHTGDY